MSFKLGKRSKDNYNTLHPDLQKIIDMALKVSQVDFTIIEGERTVERQQKLFNEGKSKIDGINKKGKHNYSPSLAFDFIAADFNQDGKITSGDALEILKFSVGIPGSSIPEWVFLKSDGDVGAVTKNDVKYESAVAIDIGEVDSTVGLVGVLIGDVNGSYDLAIV